MGLTINAVNLAKKSGTAPDVETSRIMYHTKSPNIIAGTGLQLANLRAISDRSDPETMNHGGLLANLRRLRSHRNPFYAQSDACERLSNALGSILLEIFTWFDRSKSAISKAW